MTQVHVLARWPTHRWFGIGARAQWGLLILPALAILFLGGGEGASAVSVSQVVLLCVTIAVGLAAMLNIYRNQVGLACIYLFFALI